MSKLLTLVLLGSFVVRVLSGQWPWQLWANSERSQREAQARALLGLDRSASLEDILEAHRRLLVRVHPDRGGSNEAVHQANEARDVLLARLQRIGTDQG